MPRAVELGNPASAASQTGESMGRSFLLLADERTFQLAMTSLYLVVALLAAAFIIALVQRWRRQNDAKEDVSPTAQLAHFRSLYEAGSISAEEFERLRSVLGGRIRDNLGMPATPAKPTEETPPSSAKPPPKEPDTGVRPA
jgi:uncharacterized membrane protein